MSDRTGTREQSRALRSLGNLRELLDLIERPAVVDAGDKKWLTIKEVVERLRAAGYADSSDTIRRMVDDGEFGSQGQDWYRTERGRYRMVSDVAVDALIARRRGTSTTS